jgi:uncharacterized protein YcbX
VAHALVASRASFDHIFNACPEKFFTMYSFRPNIVVRDCPEFAEDTWKNFSIGEI